MSVTKTMADGFYFGEAPRWHQDQLWFSDIHGQRVFRLSLGGELTQVLRLEDDLPSGLGWLPDGRLLVVAMDTQQLRRLDHNGTPSIHAHLSDIARGTLNDMIVGYDGTAYVGDTGFRLWAESIEYAPGQLIVVAPDGTVRQVLEDFVAPNGVAITEDGRTLIVAESGGPCLTAFDVAADGSLSNRRIFADLKAESPIAPDGICLDVQGAVWLADPIGKRVVRVLEGGEVTDSVNFEEVPVACALAGAPRQTLLVCVSPAWHRTEALAAPLAHIEGINVSVGGSGRP